MEFETIPAGKPFLHIALGRGEGIVPYPFDLVGLLRAEAGGGGNERGAFLGAADHQKRENDADADMPCER